jgi:hypothetical protein
VILRGTRILSRSLVAGSAVFLAYCSSSPNSSPTSPASIGITSANTAALNDSSPTPGVPAFGELEICKEGTNGTFTLAVTPINGGVTSTVGSPLDVAAGQCRVVAVNSGTDGAGGSVVVTETSPGLVSASALRIDIVNGNPVQSGPNPFANGSAVLINAAHGQTVTFVNEEPPPPTGNQGCTPGYWKQSQHFGSWTTYTQNADFDATFAVDFFNPNITLLEALGRNGGGVNALARHGGAALLNSASAGVDYAYTTAQVIDVVQGDGAYSGLSIEARKNLLAAANEGAGGCPLGRAE